MKCLLLLEFLIIFPITTHQKSSELSSYYIGAVVEYSPMYIRNGGASVADQNLENYMKFVEKAYKYDVDILVFPESSLSISSSRNDTIARSEASYIPAPKDNITPCGDSTEKYTNALKTLSCAARKYGMYIVINHREKVDCNVNSTGCPVDGLLIYNTNVVFDRSGRVIARYRKYNLFGEKGTNIEPVAVPSTFKTDFGVNFGQFICFDITFQSPALNLTRDLGITDIVFSSHWFSELPYLFSVQAQAAWAYANDVNLLASGLNFPRMASGGSGIYIGREGYTDLVSKDKNSNVLVVSEVPKFIDGKRAKSVNALKSIVYEFTHAEIGTTEPMSPGKWVYLKDNLAPYTTELIDLTINKTNPMYYNKTVCDRRFCCEFKLNLTFDESLIQSDSKYYRYRLAVFDGVRTYSGLASGGVKTCGIISCINDTLDGCTESFDFRSKVVKPVTFQSIHISTMNLISANVKETFFMPITFTMNMMPFQSSDFSFDNTNAEEISIYEMHLKKEKNNLLTFAIYGRNFALDGKEPTSVSTVNKATVFVTFSFILTSMISLTC